MDDELLELVREARPAFQELPDGQAVLERVPRGSGRRVRSRSLFRRGAPVAVAIGAAVVVAAVAVLTLHGHPSPGRAGAGGHAVRGEIVDRDGLALAATITKGRRVGTRVYPDRDLAAQVVGTVLPAADSARTPASALPGWSGLEAEYNPELRRGETVKTTLDANVQLAGDRALQHAIDANPPATGGAFVALDPGDGQVYAMGSLPTYDANVFTRPIPAQVSHELFAPDGPLLDRATGLAGPSGSTFAPITALAALESGAWTVGETFDDTGQFCFDGQCRHNSGDAVDGVLDLESALKVSSNDFFYNLGALTNSPPSAPGGSLQGWARALGIGHATGIDLPGESAGTLPTPAWRAGRNQLEAECDAGTGRYAGRPKHPPGGCGIADGTDRPWSAGDNENLAVGQGDVQVTPLQLAVAYAALANGGTVVRPHLDLATAAPPRMRLDINPRDLAVVNAGLRAASSQPGGNSADVFGGFPEQVYGETGTAQYAGQQDYAWYAGFVPASATSKPIVVVVTVERGGFGDVAAAPVARQIFSQWFLGRPGPWIAGASRTL